MKVVRSTDFYLGPGFLSSGFKSKTFPSLMRQEQSSIFLQVAVTAPTYPRRNKQTYRNSLQPAIAELRERKPEELWWSGTKECIRLGRDGRDGEKEMDMTWFDSFLHEHGSTSATTWVSAASKITIKILIALLRIFIIISLKYLSSNLIRRC